MAGLLISPLASTSSVPVCRPGHFHDLVTDPFQSTNLCRQHPEIVDHLTRPRKELKEKGQSAANIRGGLVAAETLGTAGAIQCRFQYYVRPDSSPFRGEQPQFWLPAKDYASGPPKATF
jgi:hypothetical protein